MYEVEPILIKRQNVEPLDFVDSLNLNYITHKIYESGKQLNTPKMSIGVLGYRNIEQTKRCVESVLKHVGDIDYELILMDNGSCDNDETYMYFQSVPTKKKKIIKVEEPIGVNYGSIYGTQLMYKYSTGDYFVFLGNDNIITENALQNMIACLDSDVNIGLVTPMSSNVWMLQNPGFVYSNYDEVFEIAKQFNKHDPRKWEERVVIATVATAIKREAADRVGFFDGLAEYTLCMRFRQAGYKTILLGDTWVCHDHNYDDKKDSQPWIGKDEKSTYIREMGVKLGLEHFGFKTFEDILVFQHSLVNSFEYSDMYKDIPNVLSIDVRCGQGMLDLKNKLRASGCFQSNAISYTTDAKYYKWLETVADRVFCDRVEYIDEVLADCKFDYIILGEPINMYNEPIKLMQRLLNLLNENGQVAFKVRNTSNYYTFLNILNISNSVDGEMPIHITTHDILSCAKLMGFNYINVAREKLYADEEMINQIRKIIIDMNVENVDIDKSVNDIFTLNYIVTIKK